MDEYGGVVEDLDPSCSSGARETTAEVGEVVSDVDASEGEISSGDDSTDIDAVVKEYKDTIQVRTWTMDNNFSTPVGSLLFNIRLLGHCNPLFESIYTLSKPKYATAVVSSLAY